MDEKEAMTLSSKMNAKLAKQRKDLMLFHDYYKGRFPKPYVPYEDATEFQSLLDRSVTNWCKKVVNITVRRLEVMGVMSATDSQAAQELWAVWERSNMGGKQRQTYRSSSRYGLGYEVVGRRRGTDETVIRPMSPMSTVHVNDPDDPDVMQVGFHVTDDADDPAQRRLWLWTPDEWVVINPKGKRGAKIIDQGEHGLGRPPLVVFRNEPDEDGGWTSDLDGILPIQDRINQTIADRLMTQSYGAYRQRLLLGWAPEKDEDGNDVKTLRPAVQRIMFINQDPSTIKATEFDATPLAPFLEATEADVRHLAALSDTPPHHLLGQMTNMSADALKAAESGHSAKVEQHKADYSDPREDVFRLVAQYEGLPVDSALQVVWKDTEPHSEAQRMDALSKKDALGVPREQLWLEMGYSPEQIVLLKQQAKEQMDTKATSQAAAFGITAA